jgi:uncharacterized protein YfaS (alpha-2-macroglobulin family)
MKNIVFIFILIGFSFAFGQESGYTYDPAKEFEFISKQTIDEEWKKYDSLMMVRQPNAARSILMNILHRHRNTDNVYNVVRVYQLVGETTHALEINDRIELFSQLLDLSEQLQPAAKALAELILIKEVNWNYNQWFSYYGGEYIRKIGIRSYNFRDEMQRAEYVFDKTAALQQELDAFYGIPFSPFVELFKVESKNQVLVESLFDYLAHSIIHIYNSSAYSRYFTELTDEGAYPGTEWLVTPDRYAAIVFNKKSHRQLPLRIYQQLEARHKDDPELLNRLHYYRMKQVLSSMVEPTNMNEIWQTNADFYGDTKHRVAFEYEIFRNYYLEGRNYHFKNDTAVEKDILKAKKLAQKTMERYPDNWMAEAITELIRLIERPELELTQLNYAYPKADIPLKLRYRNLDEVKLEIYQKPKKNKSNHSIRILLKENEATLIRTEKLTLKNQGDHNFRDIEALLDGIADGGDYFLVVTHPDIDVRAEAATDSSWSAFPHAINEFKVTEIFASSMRNGEGDIEFIVTDFKTGKPIKGARVNLYIDRYINILPNVPNRTGTTDKSGRYSSGVNNYFTAEIIHKKSRLLFSDYNYGSYKEKEVARVEIFTDRGIYRPGQTVYFKGIVHQGKENEYKVLTNTKMVVKVLDASYQEIHKQELTTNDFGSVNGSFQLPLGGSLGNFHLYIEFDKDSNRKQSSNKSFRVEEYKRPTFSASIQLPEQEAKLDDTVRVTGIAKAYAGYPISGATVNVKVYRNWGTYWRFYGGYSNEDLVRTFDVVTDEKGEFDVSFFAQSSPDAPTYAYYNFRIEADVTDISGETHPAQLSLPLSKTGLSIQYNGTNSFFKHEDKTATFQVVNLSGKPQENYELAITVIQKEYGKGLIDRIWTRAEFSNIDEKEWRKQFPLEQVGEVERELVVSTFNVKVGDTLDLKNILGNQQGTFELKALALTPSGDTLRSNTEISIIDVKSKELPKPELLWSFASHGTREVGKSVEFQVGSSIPNARAFVQLRRGSEVIQEKWVDLKNRQAFCYTIQEKDRGYLSFSAYLVYNGDRYSAQESVTVPFDNKELIVKQKTFRDELLPGAHETWSFEVTGSKGEQAMAEVLAGMYDASLDQFASNSFGFWLYRGSFFYASYGGPEVRYPISIQGRGAWLDMSYNWNRIEEGLRKNPLAPSGIDYYYRQFRGNDYRYKNLEVYDYAYSESMALEEVQISVRGARNQLITRQDIAQLPARAEGNVAATVGGVAASFGDDSGGVIAAENTPPPIQVRENFNETAFFYPELRTNDKGEFVVEFTLPESLTEWKFLALAHTKDLKIGSLQLNATAKKHLMVTSNAPRFFRQGDSFDFASKVVNLTEEEQTVEVELTFFNPMNNAAIQLIGRQPQSKMVTVPANSSMDVVWNLNLDIEPQVIAYKITASNEAFSDGEQKPIPVLSNRLLVTEALPFILVDAGETKVSFDALKNNKSATLKHESLTLEYTPNPAWNAILALPYLAEFPYECSEQLFSRYFANALAADVVQKKPRIKAMFEIWKFESPENFRSELEKNQDLKTILLEETPWVMQAKNESDRRQKLGELFDLNQLSNGQQAALRKLKNKQNSDGGFGWFGGNRSSVFITQYIVAGFGQLKNLGVAIPDDAEKMVNKALNFMDDYHVKYYNSLKEEERKYLTISSIQLHWLYASAYFKRNHNETTRNVITIYTDLLKKEWHKFSMQQQAMAGLYFHATGDEAMTKLILASLRDRAKTEKLKGMYFPENIGGRYWDERKIGTHAMITEFFVEAGGSQQEIDALRLWLILHKKTNAWESTKATSMAVYAILLRGTDYMERDQETRIVIGGEPFDFSTKNSGGSGNAASAITFQHRWHASEVSPKLGDISITKSIASPSTGALYWQYFEEMSKVKASQHPSISVEKRYYRVVAGSKGDELQRDTLFKIGERVRIELIIRTDQDLEFVHLKDLRPASFEPITALSQHHWNQGLWYYQSPRDVSMNYFIDRMEKGSYTFYYDVFVNASGSFEAGFTSVQCMYAPEYVGQSKGMKVEVRR